MVGVLEDSLLVARSTDTGPGPEASGIGDGRGG